MLRKHIIQNYITGNSPDYIIGHSSSMLFRSTILIVLLLFVWYGTLSVIEYYRQNPYLVWIFATIGIILLIKHSITFFNMYLDCLVLSQKGITLFMRDWLMTYKTDFFERHTIEAISHNQNSIRDKIFNKGDLQISLNEAITFPFENVPNPKKTATMIQKLKERYGIITVQHPTTTGSIADYTILMEALGEVVQEYVAKKKKPKDPYGDEDEEYTDY